MNHSVEKLKGVPIPIVPLFCQIDNFCQDFESILNHHLLSDGKQKGAEKKKYTGSESSHDLHCPVSSFWLSSLQALLQPVRLPVFALGIPLISQLQSVCAVDGWCFVTIMRLLQSQKGSCTGISFIDSMPLAVCHNRRIPYHRVLAKTAKQRKNSVGWFHGFKLHLMAFIW